MMLASVVLVLASGTVAAQGGLPQPTVIDLMPKPCTEEAAGADVTVCARRVPDYRIDPGVLAGVRAREAVATDLRSGQQKAVQGSCHEEQSKCQGSGVVPVLPAALKAIEAAVLAIRGEDWKEPFRTKPDAYQVHRAEEAKARARVRVGVSARPGNGPR